MSEIKKIILNFFLFLFFSTGIFSCFGYISKEEQNKPERHVIRYERNEREYYIIKPDNFNPAKKYWLLVVVHGGGGNGRTFFMTNPLRDEADKQGLETIVIAPNFSNTDFLASRFPVLGEGEFLKQVIKDAKNKYNLRPKILITGYSRGGQFSHRFAFQNPKMVKACAPFAAGTWTTPNGKLLIDSFGEVKHPESFLAPENIVDKIPGRLHNLFQPRVAEVAGLKAKKGAEKIPFLVMCGTLDTRFDIAQEFAARLKSEGYTVQSEWPRTPHGEKEKYKSEFSTYSEIAIQFFLHVTKGK